MNLTVYENMIRSKYYVEAIHYMENAKETLTKAGKEDDLIIEKIKPAA